MEKGKTESGFALFCSRSTDRKGVDSDFVERNLWEVYGKNLLLYGQNANMGIEETELEWRGVRV